MFVSKLDLYCSVDPSVTTILLPRIRILSKKSSLFQFIFDMWSQKNEHKQKEVGIGSYLKWTVCFSILMIFCFKCLAEFFPFSIRHLHSFWSKCLQLLSKKGSRQKSSYKTYKIDWREREIERKERKHGNCFIKSISLNKVARGFRYFLNLLWWIHLWLQWAKLDNLL